MNVLNYMPGRNLPWVIKVGGSLLIHAREIMQVIAAQQPDALILPGGGMFADAVRGCRVEGTSAHWMAILGMEQYGWYLAESGISYTTIPEFTGFPRIFLPYQFLKKEDPLPHSWDITSDSISAWLASHLHADLIILKSIDNIRAEGHPLKHITTQVDTPDLDPACIPFILDHHLSGAIINGTKPDQILNAIHRMPVIGTTFGTII